MGFWLEIVTLLIPGFNDSEDELRGLTDFLVSVSPYIPWHITAFHKDYKMDDPDNTRPEDLQRAAEIGKKAGLRYIYAGNLPGMVGDLEDTRCHNCSAVLVKRYSYFVQDRKSTRLNSSHGYISYAVFCLKKKKKNDIEHADPRTVMRSDRSLYC